MKNLFLILSLSSMLISCSTTKTETPITETKCCSREEQFKEFKEEWGNLHGKSDPKYYDWNEYYWENPIDYVTATTDGQSFDTIMKLLTTQYMYFYGDTIGFTGRKFSINNLSTAHNDGSVTGNIAWFNADGRMMSSPVSSLSIPTSSPVPTAISPGGRSFNTAYQLSSTRPAKISISSQISCALSLTTGQSGNVQLQISANGSTGWITIAQFTASNTGTLVIGLNTTQISGGQLVCDLPTGYYWKAVTNNITGTPTYTFNGGAEIVY